jgi:hypothetical protein
MSRRSMASITHESIMDLIVTIGELASSFAVYARCFRPSAHPLPLMIPLLFFVVTEI